MAIANGASSGTTYSATITTLTDKAWLVDVVNSGAGGLANSFTATTAGMVERWDRNVGVQLVGAGSTREVSPAGTVTNTWTSTGSSRRAQSIAAFAPAPPAPVAVAILSPTNTAVVSSTSFTINANATVNPGSVTNVDFYVDAALVGSDTSYPFSFAVNGAAAGAHVLQVVAMDSGGIMATSVVVNVTADNLAPAVALTSPANGGAVLVGASVALAATASDDSAVTNVDFYVDGALVGSDDSNPFASTWPSATPGAHALTAVAQDNGGLSTTSAVVNITAYASFAAYEPFNYASLPNGTASTASGFTGNWTCGTTPSIVAGMTYTGLPVANSAISSGSGRQSVNFLAPLSGGTEYVSFLLRASGNMGGNIDGVYFPNGGTGLFFGFGLAPNTGTQGGFGLGTTTTTGTGAVGAANLASSFQGIYGNTYLVVLKIDFNTSGNNDTVTAYINPTANSATPGVAATYTVSSFDVGTITGIGLTVQGGATMTLDEIRRGATYGDVVGYNPPATPTGLAATAGVNSVSLSWNVASGATGYNVLRGTTSGVY
ncbi:MAG: Ig-like domain-containing protein, partial [Verrucomicrobiota bacterium]